MIRYTFHFLLILFILEGLSACSIMPSELATAEQLIETAPDSALHILQHIPAYKLNYDKSRALYGLLMIQVLDRKHLPLKPDSLLDFSIDYYQNHKDGDRLATSYLFRGRTCKYAAEYEKAMNYYLKSQDEIQNSNNYVLIGRINLDMGDIYNIQGDYKLAREKYKKAYIYFKKAHFQPQSFYSILNIARTYHDAKNYKTAQKYFRKIICEAKDSIQLAALYQEMGLNFYDSKQLDSALFYYRISTVYPYIGINRSIRYSYLAELYFSMKQYDSAFIYAKKAFNYGIEFRTQRDCYRIMTNCEFKRGHMREMSMYMNMYVQLSDSIRKIDTQIKGSYMETTHIAKKEAAKNKYIAWYLGLLALMLLIASYLVYRFITHRSREEKLQLQQTHTGEKVSIHKKVIEDKRAILQQQIEKRKKQMLTEFKNAGAEEREKQLRNIYKELLHYDEPVLFYQEMDKFLNVLITKLRSRFATLNENELKLCCYLLLHIPTYDMLLLFRYKSDDGLKTLKRRLSKRLNLENATALEDFLLTLLAEN